MKSLLFVPPIQTNSLHQITQWESNTINIRELDRFLGVQIQLDRTLDTDKIVLINVQHKHKE